MSRKLFCTAVQKFIELCEIPELYEGVPTGSVTIDIGPGRGYNNEYNNIVTAEITINCSNPDIAIKIHSHRDIFDTVMEMLKITEIRITAQKQAFREVLNYLFFWGAMKHTTVDLNQLNHSSHPVYIVAMHNHELLFANSAAFVQHSKKPAEFIGENVASLSYPDELEYRMRLLRMDGELTNYENKALNWYKDEHIWRRKEVNLVSNFKKIEFLGIECRLSHELMIEETHRFVD